MQNSNATVETLMKRGFLYLEDHNFEYAGKYFNDSLDMDPENSQAYIGMLLTQLRLEKESDLLTCPVSFFDNPHYQKAIRFANEEYSKELRIYNLENIYFRANELLSTTSNEDVKVADIEQAKDLFKSINGFKDAKECVEKCETLIEQLKQKKEAKKKGLLIKIGIILGVIIVLTTIVLCSKISANEKLALEIYQNFLEKEFDGEEEDDNGFYSDYSSNSLSPYMTYWLEKEARSLTFNKDGSVYYTCESSMTALAYPSSMSKPEGTSYEYDGTYSSFDVKVALDGEVYLIIGSERYSISVNDENVPTAIHNYKGIWLD